MYQWNSNTKEQDLVDVDVMEKTLHPFNLIVWNDEVNTFDWVIETLVEVCGHSEEQAEQCAILVHYKGQCTVKTGAFNELKPQCTQLLEAGLSAEII